MKIIKYIAPFVFILLGFLLYSNVLYGPFLFDDKMYIVNNYWIWNIPIFLKDFSGTRYIGFLSFALNYYFGGLNTFGYHIINILIHILNTFLVYLLVEITLDRLKTQDSRLETQNFELTTPVAPCPMPYASYLPFTVSLIFLVHPIQTQAVSYITQRFTSLATLFYLLSIVLYVKSRLNCLNRSNRFFMPYALCILSTILAMKTKEISFTLPFIILFYEFTFLSNSLKPSALCPLLFDGSYTSSPSSSPLLLFLYRFLVQICQIIVV